MKFSIKKRGYDQTEVDNYVIEAEDCLLSQKERIQRLKSKVASLERELDGYYDKKDLIVAALSEALKKAEEIEVEAARKYELELQRLKLFHERWTEHYNKLIKSYPELTSNTEEFNREMDKIFLESELNSDAIEPIYNSEKTRLLNKQKAVRESRDGRNSRASVAIEGNDIDYDDEQASPLDRIKMYLENEGTAITSAENQEGEEVFSLEEALNPKQNLKEIMRDLGLLEE